MEPNIHGDPDRAGSAVKNLSFPAWRGQPYPLGATWDGSGVNFALFSEHASAVQLCLFDNQDPRQQIASIPVKERTDLVWHVYIPDLKPGQLYGYRVHGPYEPHKGHRFNPAKVVLDPYGKAISGTVQWNEALYGYSVGHPDVDLSKDGRDSAPFMPKSVVIDRSFDWGEDISPRTP